MNRVSVLGAESERDEKVPGNRISLRLAEGSSSQVYSGFFIYIDVVTRPAV